MMTHTHCRSDSSADTDSIFSDDAEASPSRAWHERRLDDLADVATLFD